MAWIEGIPVEKATGLLKQLYDEAMKRTGFVSKIRRVQSLNPETLRDGGRMYATLMFGGSPLSRAQREMLATVVSAALNCRY